MKKTHGSKQANQEVYLRMMKNLKRENPTRYNELKKRETKSIQAIMGDGSHLYMTTRGTMGDADGYDSDPNWDDWMIIDAGAVPAAAKTDILDEAERLGYDASNVLYASHKTDKHTYALVVADGYQY